jgi:hypothetical protein
MAGARGGDFRRLWDTRPVRGSLIAASAVLVAASTAAGAALASGGLSISRAPMISAGAKVSENSQVDPTASGGDAVGQGCFNDVEYWRIQLRGGDKVEVKGTETIAARGFLIAFFAPGTTDKKIASATSVAHGFTGEHAVRFTAKATGVYPIVAGPNCYNGTDGPYTFVVSVRHAS